MGTAALELWSLASSYSFNYKHLDKDPGPTGSLLRQLHRPFNSQANLFTQKTKCMYPSSQPEHL